MNRITTALFAALEALIVVAISVGIALVPLTLLWAFQFGLAIDWFVFWRAAADVWLLGNGVDLTVNLDPEVVVALGLPGTGAPFPITMTLLGFALLAVLLGVRTGLRTADAPHPLTAVVASIIAYGLLAAAITFSAGQDIVRPAPLQGILLPTLIFAAGVLTGAVIGRTRLGSAAGTPRLDPVSRFIRERYGAVPLTTRTMIAAAVRGGLASATAVVAVSAVAVAVLLVVNYATVIGLYETLQAGILGGVTLTLVQLALIPNLVAWAAAWFIGPGIAVGVGTSVSPVGTALGSVPGLPILGALPHGTLAFGFVGLLVPVLIGFAAAVIVRQRLDRTSTPTPTTAEYVVTGLAMGLVAGVLLGLLAWWSAGAIGPGRLSQVGPNPWLVGALAAAEIGIAGGLGMLAGARRGAAARIFKR